MTSLDQQFGAMLEQLRVAADEKAPDHGRLGVDGARYEFICALAMELAKSPSGRAAWEVAVAALRPKSVPAVQS